MLGGVRSSAMPLNSSAPMSGALALRVWPSISSVMPATGMPPLSSWEAIDGSMCRKVGLEPVVSRKFGFSLTEAESRGAIVPAVNMPFL